MAEVFRLVNYYYLPSEMDDVASTSGSLQLRMWGICQILLFGEELVHHLWTCGLWMNVDDGSVGFRNLHGLDEKVQG